MAHHFLFHQPHHGVLLSRPAHLVRLECPRHPLVGEVHIDVMAERVVASILPRTFKVEGNIPDT